VKHQTKGGENTWRGFWTKDDKVELRTLVVKDSIPAASLIVNTPHAYFQKNMDRDEMTAMGEMLLETARDLPEVVK